MELPNVSETPEKQEEDVTLKSDSSNVEAGCDNKSNDNAAAEVKVETVVETPVVSETRSKDEIISSLEALMEKPVEQVKDEVNQLKIAFYSIRKQEIEQEKAAFLEKGNEEAAFAVAEDPLELKLKELLAQYKEKRSEHIAAIEAIKKENLNKKLEILEKLKEIANDTDNINRHYNKFQQLQQEFKVGGDVPQESVTQIWKDYQTITEDFYDKLKINKELRDYDFKKNIEAKLALIAIAEELDTEVDIIAAFKKLQELHNQWREIGPVAQEKREEVWQKFKDASAAINKKYQAFFEGRKEKEKENEDAKNAICEKIEAIDFSKLTGYSAWEETTEKIKSLQEEWKTLGFAARKVNVALFARFRKSCDDFFAAKAEYFKKMKEESNSNLQKKIALCEKVEALKDSTDWKATTNELVAFQKEWKTIGPVSKKHSDSVWKRFITACDYFFEQKEKQTSNIHKEEHANLDAKKEIISTLSSLLKEDDDKDAASKVRGLMNKWREIGHVPFKEKDKIYNEYQALLKEAFDKFDIKENRAKMSNFENSVSKLADNSDKLFRERERQMRILDQKRNELKTYENNMTFFTAKSKTGNSMLKEMERKISMIKEDIALLEKKIELIDSKF